MLVFPQKSQNNKKKTYNSMKTNIKKTDSKGELIRNQFKADVKKIDSGKTCTRDVYFSQLLCNFLTSFDLISCGDDIEYSIRNASLSPACCNFSSNWITVSFSTLDMYSLNSISSAVSIGVDSARSAICSNSSQSLNDNNCQV